MCRVDGVPSFLVVSYIFVGKLINLKFAPRGGAVLGRKNSFVCQFRRRSQKGIYPSRPCQLSLSGTTTNRFSNSFSCFVQVLGRELAGIFLFQILLTQHCR